MLIFGLMFSVSGCSDQSINNQISVEMPGWIDSLPENEAGQIVRKAVDWAGGWETWMTKENLSYLKSTDYVDTNGLVTRSLQQRHHYILGPEPKFNISWEEDGDQFRIVYDGQQAGKFKNGEAMTDQSSINQAWNSSFGSHYVMCMPFKLADPGTELQYEGIINLPDSSAVHSIKVTYKEGAGSAAGMHTWWYYFDTETYRPVANFLDYGDGYSYTVYESFVSVDGIQMNAVRSSFRAGPELQSIKLSTRYRNSEVEFNVEIPKFLFDFPTR